MENTQIIKPKPILVLLLNAFLPVVLAFLYGMLTGGVIPEQTMIITCFATAITIIISYFFIREEINQCFRDITSITHFIFWIVIMWIVFYIGNSVIQFCLQYFMDITAIPTNENWIEGMVDSSYIAAIIYGGVLAPISEELAYRYGLIGTNNKYVVLKVIFSSVIFGVAHVSGGPMIYSIHYIFMGFGFAFLYKKTNNILYPIGFHIFNNMVGLLLF
ncbi:MAG: hypothetical protein ATN33_03685 [Epulopiscium sp. Nele67-Bin001]|nr:MAG: hypothetical protein ATN33_03685 [Epulopiscium sp. Nele67-Bin001]